MGATDTFTNSASSFPAWFRLRLSTIAVATDCAGVCRKELLDQREAVGRAGRSAQTAPVETTDVCNRAYHPPAFRQRARVQDEPFVAFDVPAGRRSAVHFRLPADVGHSHCLQGLSLQSGYFRQRMGRIPELSLSIRNGRRITDYPQYNADEYSFHQHNHGLRASRCDSDE